MHFHVELLIGMIYFPINVNNLIYTYSVNGQLVFDYSRKLAMTTHTLSHSSESPALEPIYVETRIYFFI
jgi:hypothetical protein